MKLDSVVFTVAGMAFGVILGWLIGAQQLAKAVNGAPAPAAVAQNAPPPASGGTSGGRTPPVLDESRVKALTDQINSDPKNPTAVVQLANVYFDAERWTDAISWYEQALRLDPKNAD